MLKTMNEERKYIVLYTRKNDTVDAYQVRSEEPKLKFLHSSNDYESCKEFAKKYFDWICGHILHSMDMFVGPFKVNSFTDNSGLDSCGYDNVIYSVSYQKEVSDSRIDIHHEAIHILQQESLYNPTLDPLFDPMKMMDISCSTRDCASRVKDKAQMVTIGRTFQNEEVENR